MNRAGRARHRAQVADPASFPNRARDLFNYVMAHDGCTFVEAMRALAIEKHKWRYQVLRYAVVNGWITRRRDYPRGYRLFRLRSPD